MNRHDADIVAGFCFDAKLFVGFIRCRGVRFFSPYISSHYV